MSDDAPDAATGRSATPHRHRRGAAERGEAEFDRGVSFFDAIYGFAATLLIANVDAPSPDTWSDISALLDSHLLMQLLGLALSFTVICVMWRLNVRLTRELRGLDGPTTVINLVAVGLVVLLPFTTQGISDTETADLALPTAFYALNVAAASLAQTLMFVVARARGLEREPTSPRENRIRVMDALITPVYFVLTVPVAFVWDADIAKLLWLGLIPLGILSGRLRRRAIARDAARSKS